MSKQDYQKWRLTCISPVFIGSGETWNPGQYIYDPQKETVFFLHEHQWIQFLYRQKVFPQFARYIIECAKNQQPASLFFWIRDNLIRKNGFRSVEEALSSMKEAGVIRKEEKVEIGLTHNGKKASANEIHTFIRGGGGCCYMPGSTLKGAFRTAILFRALSRHPEKYQSRWQELLCAPNKKGFERIGESLETDLTVPAEHRGKISEAVVYSCFRGLSVSDAELTSEKMGIVQKWDWGDRAASQGKEPKSLPIYRESLVPGSAAEFSISVDPAVMAPLEIESAEDVLSAVREWTDYQYELLRPAFGQFRGLLEPMKKADLILGGGTGFFNKTVLYPLAPDRKEAVSAARKLMEEQFPRHHHEKDRALSPHTLKLTRWGGGLCPMGLCCLEVL